MSFSGGVYTLPTSVNPVATGTTITINWANTTLNDIATALSSCLLKDGTQTATASIPFAQGISVGAFVLDSSGNLAVTTNKFTITASSGDTLIAGSLTANGAVTLGDAAADNITVNGTVTSNVIFTDNTYDIGASGATRPRDFFLARNAVIGGTTTLTGNVISDLTFTDATYDIGKSGATRPRDGFFSRNFTVGGTLGVQGTTTLTGNVVAGTATGGQLTIASAGTGAGILQIGPAVPSADGSGILRMLNSNATKNWMIAHNQNVAGVLEFTPSTANGGSTFTNAELLLSATAGAGRIPNGIRIGADSSNNLLDDASNGAGTATLYIGNASINVTSDVRVKPYRRATERDALALVNQIEIIDHDWDDPSDKSENNRNSRGLWMGLSAQQIVDITPWAVNAPDRNCQACRAGQKCAEHKSLWHVEREHLVPLLIRAIQQMSGRLNAND